MFYLIPESATMSVVLRPLLEKAVTRPLRSERGEGRSLLAVLKLAVVASLLPNRTVHEGPLSCKQISEYNSIAEMD